MTKKEIRKIYREKRSSITNSAKTKLDDLLLIKMQTASLPFINTLLSFWPIIKNNEPDTNLLTRYLSFVNPNLITCYPKSDFNKNEMVAIVTDEHTKFVLNEFEIYEPDNNTGIAVEAIDLVFVPLLAFDEKGYRVGYGKGFYDKFLTGCRADCIKMGISYFPPVPEITDKHEFDVPLDLCITPNKLYVF